MSSILSGLRGRFLSLLGAAYLGIALAALGLFFAALDGLVDKLGRQWMEQQARVEQLRILSPIEREVDLSLQMMRSPLIRAWLGDEENAGLREQALQELEGYRQRFRDHELFIVPDDSLHFYYSDGKASLPTAPVAYTLDAEAPKDHWYSRVLSRPGEFELYIDYDEVLGVSRLWINVAARDGEQVFGVGGTGLDLGAFVDDNLMESGAEVTNLLFDADGLIKAHPDPRYVPRNSLVETPEQQTDFFDLLDSDADRTQLRAALSRLEEHGGKPELLYLNVEGKRYLAALAPLRELGWNLLVLSDLEQLMGTQDFILLVLLLVASLLALSLLAVWLIDRLVLKRLMVLVNGAQEVASGNYAVTTQLDGDDEIADLAAVFNQMTATIRAHTEDLKRLVAERTEALAEALKQVSLLLDNSGEGFLSCGRDLKVRSGYSRECEILFGRAIGGEPLATLLFSADSSRAGTLEQNLRMILETDDELRREMLMGLLPTEVSLGERFVRLNYRLLEESAMMLVVTDITAEKALEDRVLSERERLRFVVTAVRNRDEVLALIAECQHFQDKEVDAILASSPAPAHERHAELFRRIHTYKGLFSQLDFISLPQRLHAIEDRLARLGEESEIDAASLRTIRPQLDCKAALEQDLAILRRFLGASFFSGPSGISLDEATLSTLERLAVRLETLGLDRDPDTSAALDAIRRLRLMDFRVLLEGYPKYALQLAQRNGKAIHPFAVAGEAVLVDPERFASFAKSLIHLFRNAVEHGIEPPDERLVADKDERGTIACQVEQREGELLLRVADDGQGLDLEILRGVALEKGLIGAMSARQVDQAQLAELIFADGVSTRETVSELSGRGEGLAAVKMETERLDGRVWIETECGQGTTFNFALPLTDD